MRISAINTYYPYTNKTPAFTHHKDYDDLRWKHGTDIEGTYIIDASSYFRRGRFYGSPIDSYQDVVDTFNLVFKDKKYPKQMLIVGVADSQEPFSYLASIKEIIGKKSLDKALNLNIVDLKSKPKDYEVYRFSYFDKYYAPKFALSSFVKDEYPDCYRVKNDIYKYLSDTYNNKMKSKWETRVQEASLDYPSESFDIISIQNVLPYINDKDGQESINLTLENLYRSLKPGGILIADPYREGYSVSSPVFDKMTEIYDGIYKKAEEPKQNPLAEFLKIFD